MFPNRYRLRWLLPWVLALSSVDLFGADLAVSIAPRWRGDVLAVPSVVVRNDLVQSLRVTRLSALLSGFELTGRDGQVVRLDGQYGYIDAESHQLTVTLRGVPESDYVGIAFRIGLPRDVNHADPGRWPATHPLNPLTNRLHWSWRGGYIFAALEGRWMDGAEERGFSYHLANDEQLMSVRFQTDFRVGPATTVALAWDLARVLGRQHFAADDASTSTHSGEGDRLAPKLARAVERAWFFLDAQERSAVSAARGESAIRIPTATAAIGTPVAFNVPAGWPQPALPGDNPLTAEGIALGARLFTDRRLSAGKTQSCANCHAPARAFSDTVALSRGAEGKPGRRNAMPLVNLAWSPSFAWDGSQPRIRDQALAAMTNPVEMHADVSAVIVALSTDRAMGSAFTAAFGTPVVTVERIGLALEQYLLTQVSADAKFDRAVRGEGALTEEEKEGFALFMTEYDPARGRRGADCFHCHGGPLFSDFAFKNNGLAPLTKDHGRSAVTQRADDDGKFKTPSLRNVAVTGPYMHDGRFATLADVVAHYDHGISRTPSLDPNIAKHPDAGLQLTAAEQRALVAFLRALTDRRFDASAPAATAGE